MLRVFFGIYKRQVIRVLTEENIKQTLELVAELPVFYGEMSESEEESEYVLFYRDGFERPEKKLADYNY